MVDVGVYLIGAVISHSRERDHQPTAAAALTFGVSPVGFREHHARCLRPSLCRGRAGRLGEWLRVPGGPEDVHDELWRVVLTLETRWGDFKRRRWENFCLDWDA